VLDYERKLEETVANLPLEPLALVCVAHPTPEVTAANVAAAVQHRRCLAALSPANLLELSAGGRRALWLDDSPCAQCPIGNAQIILQRSADAARALLVAAGKPPAILLHSEQRPTGKARPARVPLLDGAQPSISRRTFLARFRPIQTETIEVEEPIDEGLQRGAPVSMRLPQRAPAGHRKLLAALAKLRVAPDGKDNAGREVDTVAADGLPFGTVVVDANRCSACGLCARFCPTAALQFAVKDDTFALAFQPAACVDCGVCMAACPERAVTMGITVTLRAIFSDEIAIMAAGEMAPCTGCGTATAKAGGGVDTRCHVCRQGAGVVTSLRDDAGLMADLLKRIPQQGE
jgi:ferredoxin